MTPLVRHVHASHVTLRLQPQLDKAADGFGATGRVVLFARPSIDLCDELVGEAHRAHRILARCGPTRACAFTSDRFGYCLFHSPVLPYSGLKNKRLAVALRTPRRA